MTAKLALLSSRDESALRDRLLKHVGEKDTDRADALMSRPAAVYTDPSVADSERESLFFRMPLIVGHVSELADPGSYIVVELTRSTALVVRQADGSIRSFVNSCRHRGAPVAVQPTGVARLFSCAYHGWSYDLDGRLRSVADSSSFGELAPGCDGLIELPCEVRHGFVWVVDDPDGAIGVATFLGADLDDLLDQYDIGSFTCVRTGSYSEETNWKVLADGFLDSYHIKYLHRNTVGPYFYGNNVVVDVIGPHLRSVAPRRSIDRVKDVPVDEISIADHVTAGHFVIPNAKILRQPDHIQLLLFFPDRFEPGRSRMEMRILAPAGTETAEKWAKSWQILVDTLLDEDLPMCRSIQASLRGEHAPDVVFGRNELSNQWFHGELAARCPGYASVAAVDDG